MRIYLDDNRAHKHLAKLLVLAGHFVETPAQTAMHGASDVRHLEHAIRQREVMLTNDSDDFEELHNLIQAAGGRHPGILVVRFERDSSKKMKPRQIVAAIDIFLKSGLTFENEIIVLNHWR